MKTLLLNHDDCLRHRTGSRHPERPARVTAVLNAVQGLEQTECLPAPKATTEQIERAHSAGWWQGLLELEPAKEHVDGPVMLDADTCLSRGSIDATLRGSGATCFAVDEIMAGRARNAFCITRPPGHHAGRAIAMGFCLLNHVAVAACHARAVHGLKRVAIVDFDVHHGNGTQEIFADDPNVLFVSSHQMPLYPGTGHPDEHGCGNVFNLPLPPGAGGTEFRSVWAKSGLSALERFEPEMILVSAGFDAHALDPLAQLQLEDADYGWITTEIRRIAERICNGRIVSNLEGGYNLEALAGAATAHVTALSA
jgi:acetoin utilization deacetylase AcuC-like enzyme